MIFLTLFLEFFKIGLFTFGGGYAMIPLIKEITLNYNWLTENEFLDMIGISEITPGPIAINMATYIGSTQGNLVLGPFGAFLGSLIATIAVILPAFIIMLIVSILLKKFISNKYVQGALKGIRPVSIALIFSSAIILFVDYLFPYNFVDNQIIFSIDKTTIFVFLLIAFFALVYTKFFNKKLGPIKLIAFAAFVGITANYLIKITG